MKILWLYNLKLEQAMGDLACGDQKILLVVILRKLVTNDWLHVYPGLVSGDGGRVGGSLKLHELFLEIFIGRFKYEKKGDHRNKISFINKSIKVQLR